MIFLKPEYLYFMLLPLIIFFLFIITKKDPLESYFNKEVLDKIRIDNESLGKVGRNMMLFASLILMLLALARPVLPMADIKLKRKSIDLLVALDISRSMSATDLYPNRLEFAKKRFKEFLDNFEEANVAVIGFSEDAFLISPLTKDHQSLKYLVDNLEFDSTSQRGTNLFEPLQKANEFLSKNKQKILVIFTDGGDQKSFKDEIKFAKDKNITIYVYATATPKGSVIKEIDKVLKDKKGNIVLSKLNEHIKELALKSNGAYIAGGYSDRSVKLIANDIKRKFRLKEMDEKDSKNFKELFYYPLALAILFMLFAFSSLPRKLHSTLLFMMLLSYHLPLEAKFFDFVDISKAKSAYEEGRFQDSAKYFQEVSSSKKDDSSFYDLANAYYKSGDYQAALKVYNSIHTVDDNLNYKRWFNTGNALFKLKKYTKALEAYNKAKEIKTSDDLIHNIKLTKKMIKKSKEKKRDKKQENKNQNNKQQDNKSSKSPKKKKEKKKKQNKKDDPKKKKQKQKTQAKKDMKKLSKKEIKMWMKHLQSINPKTKPIKLKRSKLRGRVNEMPW